jgi:hypothetical protein
MMRNPVSVGVAVCCTRMTIKSKSHNQSLLPKLYMVNSVFIMESKEYENRIVDTWYFTPTKSYMAIKLGYHALWKVRRGTSIRLGASGERQ